MKSIKQYKEVFILGIGGSGMSSIAKYLSQRGAIVKGYDQRSSYITNLLENDGFINLSKGKITAINGLDGYNVPKLKIRLPYQRPVNALEPK